MRILQSGKARVLAGFVTCFVVGPVHAGNGTNAPMLTVSGGQMAAERIIWAGGGSGSQGGLSMIGGVVQVESSSANIAAGGSANPNSGSVTLSANAPGLKLGGSAIKQSDRLRLVAGGSVEIGDNAVWEITRSSIQSPPGSGQVSQNHPSLDFSSQFLSGQWSQVQGSICFTSSGSGQPGDGGLLAVLGQSETLSINGSPVVVDFEDLLMAAIANGKITTSVTGGILQVAWDGMYTKVWVTLREGRVDGSYVFYPNWSGSLGSNVDPSKQPARQTQSTQVLGLPNLLNSTGGIQGLLFDISEAGDPTAISVNDFVFQLSPMGTFSQALNPPSEWTLAPPPASIHAVPGSAGSPTRVFVQWPSGAIVNRWLRITVRDTPNTDLPSPEIFFIGHLRGETNGQLFGDSFFVTFDDITPIRQVVGSVVDSGSPLDIDKNGVVLFGDISAMRGNIGTGLSNITIP